MAMPDERAEVRYRVTGMDYPDCAAHIERTARGGTTWPDLAVAIVIPGCSSTPPTQSYRMRVENSQPLGVPPCAARSDRNARC